MQATLEREDALSRCDTKTHLKFTKPSKQDCTLCMQVDITVNNILAIVNTKLLRDYAAVDDRLLQLVFVVKLWAKRRQVNDSYRGTLSSYCYVLMCIHLLQQRSPPVLPCLQAMQPTHTRYPSHSSQRAGLCTPV